MSPRAKSRYGLQAAPAGNRGGDVRDASHFCHVTYRLMHASELRLAIA